MTDCTQNPDPATRLSIVDQLAAEGVAADDIRLALDLQATQRRAGVPVLPLRVICGLETRARPNISATLARTPAQRPRRGGLHITRRPVWAGSVRTGDAQEAEFVRPLGADRRRQMQDACYKAFRLSKELAAKVRAGVAPVSEAERRLIGFTTSCRDIFLKLLDDEKYRKGWCVPAYETIMRWTGLSRRTVHRSLRTLADLGMIEWIRRYIYSRDSEFGARSEQTSNLYRFQLPGWLAALVGIVNPLPADAQHQADESREEFARMLADASPAERRRLMPSSTEQRTALLAAALRVDFGPTRECQKNTPPHPNYIHKEVWKGIGLVGRCVLP